jgi:thioesterase domain-containing protein
MDSVEVLAAEFARQILAYRPAGPVVIAGYCAGGAIAFEVARQLRQQGAGIELVALFGSPFPTWYRLLPQLRVHLAEQAARVAKHLRAITSSSPKELANYIAAKREQRRLRLEASRREAVDPVLKRRARVEKSTLAAVRRYVPDYFDGRVVAFLPSQEWLMPANHLLRWPTSIARHVEEHCGPDACEGYSMLLEPHAEAVAERYRQARLGCR